MSGSQLVDLADGAGHRILMTLAARLCVVDRSEPILYLFNCTEDKFVVLKGRVRQRGRISEAGHRVPLHQKSISFIVEVGGGLPPPSVARIKVSLCFYRSSFIDIRIERKRIRGF